MRKTKNPINKLETPSKVKKGFRTYVALVLACTCMFVCAVPAFAAGDPITVVNNLSDFIKNHSGLTSASFVGSVVLISFD